MLNIILMGPPGAGKGTQSKFVSEKFKIPQISTGDILRANVREKTELGKKAKDFMDKGLLVPDALVVDMVAKRLDEKDCANGCILDGFPRNVKQAEALDETIKGSGHGISAVVGIEVEKKELVRRISGRRMCKKCGAAYHIIFNPPVNLDMCDKCNGDLYQRDDDKETTIEERLKVYEQETLPLVTYYKGKGLYSSVKGVGSMDEISQSIFKAIESRRGNT
ncbi:MAG: adenylate kinase [Deltaproteobacteria bacterium]|nr:adenylate kinase [Deltaproteobacteria bacterium]